MIFKTDLLTFPTVQNKLQIFRNFSESCVTQCNILDKLLYKSRDSIRTGELEPPASIRNPACIKTLPPSRIKRSLHTT